ncbi:MAG: hypothetical protein Kow0062_22880 [Acidobacteriota bacterium]
MVRPRPAVLLVLSFACSLAFAAAAADGPRLRLRAGTFDLSRLAARADGPARPDASADVRIALLRRAPDAAFRARLEALGLRVLGYVPDHAFVVRVPDPAALAALAALPELAWQGPVDPDWKLAPDLGTRPLRDPSRRAGGRLLAVVSLWNDGDLDAIDRRAGALGLEVRARWADHGQRRLLVRGPVAALRALAAEQDVAFVEEAPEPTPRNDGASWVVQTDVRDVRSIWDHGLHGEEQILGNIDGRLDIDSCYFDDGGRSPGPSHRKVIAYRSSSGLGADSHGTHTNGTMAGDRGTWGAHDPGDGHAYAARIVFANVNDIDGSGSAPSNLLDYLALAHEDGARVHSNSWGDDGTTAYTSWSRDIDDFSWQYEDSLVLFAVTNTSSLRTPENAKNVLAVGATQREENADDHCSGGTGPTSDGRRKPEIYAPGCSTVSAASNDPCGTRSLTGTSMACPAVAGAAALVRQYFVEGWYPTGAPEPLDARTPTGALLKAVLLAGTQDMTGVAGFPSDLEGWGRVHLERSLAFAGDARGLVVLDDVRRADGLGAGGEATYPLDVTDTDEDLRVTLVFTEPPAELLAATATVNDLDLEVTAPDGTVYRGNATDGAGRSVPDGSADPINNVEQVLVPAPQPGEWTVQVIARDVPIGPQGYALVATGRVVATAVGVRLGHDGHRVLDDGPLGNGDGRLDPGETIVLPVSLANRGDEDATTVRGILANGQPSWGRILRRDGAWPDIASRSSAESLPPHFELVLFPEAPCGEALPLELAAVSDAGPADPIGFGVEVGNRLRDYANDDDLTIPAFQLGFVESTIEIPDDVRVAEMDVTLDVLHEDVGELRIALVSPAGTQVVLHDHSREGERDIHARYDRDRRPDGPGSMDDFVGESAQGTWTLVLGDNRNTAVPAGRLDRWELNLRADRALECAPLACPDAKPGEVPAGLTVERSGDDLAFSWPETAGAAGYHLLEDTDPAFPAPRLADRTDGATTLVLPGAAPADGTALRAWLVRATNSCHWEGP